MLSASYLNFDAAIMANTNRQLKEEVILVNSPKMKKGWKVEFYF